jgi:hypothetical protein
MKTFREIDEWCEGAAKEFGNPSLACGQAFLRYVEKAERYRGEDLVFATDGMRITLMLGFVDFPVEIPISEDGPEVNAFGEAVSFGAELVAPGLWSLTPSLNIPGLIHVFIALYAVPTPAPWEKSLIVLAG